MAQTGVRIESSTRPPPWTRVGVGCAPGTGPAAGTTRGEFVVADITVDIRQLDTMVSALLAARR